MRKQAENVEGRRARGRVKMGRRGVSVVAVDRQCYILCSRQTTRTLKIGGVMQTRDSGDMPSRD
jgi:hypothetical protein